MLERQNPTKNNDGIVEESDISHVRFELLQRQQQTHTVGVGRTSCGNGQGGAGR